MRHYPGIGQVYVNIFHDDDSSFWLYWFHWTGVGVHVLRFFLLLLMAAWMPIVAGAPAFLKPVSPVAWRDFLGVNAHFLWFSSGQYRSQIEKLKALGLEWVRVDLHWDRHETVQGSYRLEALDELMHTLQAEDLKSLVYVVGSAGSASSAPEGSPVPDQYPPKDPRVYANFMQMLVTRYPGVNAWQIWNEPNLPSFWRPHEDPAGYAALLLAGTHAVRAARPGASVVMGGMAYYSQMPVLGGLMLPELLKLGIQRLHVIAAYHPYTTYPEGNDRGKPDFVVHGNELNSLLRHAGVPGIWATEWGWSSYAGPKEEQPIIGETGQADYLLRRLALMSAMDYDKVFLFALSDLDARATVRDQHYGLLDLQGRPKPAYRALQNFLSITGDRLVPGDMPDTASAPDDLYGVNWKRADGKHLLVFWGAAGGTLKLKGIAHATVHDPLVGTARSLSSSNDVLSVVAKPTLQLLVW